MGSIIAFISKMRKQRHREMNFLIQYISSDCHNKVPWTRGGGFTNRDLLSHSFGGWRSKIKYQYGRVLERARFLPYTQLHSCCVPTWQRERASSCVLPLFFKSITGISFLHMVAFIYLAVLCLNCSTHGLPCDSWTLSLWHTCSVVVVWGAQLLHGTWDINCLTSQWIRIPCITG